MIKIEIKDKFHPEWSTVYGHACKSRTAVNKYMRLMLKLGYSVRATIEK